MPELMTKANINQFLVDYIGIAEEEVGLMPSYVKRDIVMDDYDLFVEYITDEEYGDDE